MLRAARNVGWAGLLVGGFLLWHGVTSLVGALGVLASASTLPLFALVGGGLALFWVRDWLTDRGRQRAPGWSRSGSDLGAVTFYAPISVSNVNSNTNTNNVGRGG